MDHAYVAQAVSGTRASWPEELAATQDAETVMVAAGWVGGAAKVQGLAAFWGSKPTVLVPLAPLINSQAWLPGFPDLTLMVKARSGGGWPEGLGWLEASRRVGRNSLSGLIHVLVARQ